jgi:hypothetical protein
VLEAADTGTRQYQQYTQLWGESMGSDCNVHANSTTTNGQPFCSSDGQCVFSRMPPYCDVDDNPTTLTPWAAQSADAVLLYAQAMHALYLVDGSYHQSASDLYHEIKNRALWLGVSSTSTHLDGSGDRLGSLYVINFQSSTSVPIGRFDSATNQLTLGSQSGYSDIRFAAGMTAVSDGSCSDVSSYLAYEYQNMCELCNTRLVCDREVHFRPTTTGHEHCAVPEPLHVPCTYVNEWSSIAVVLLVSAGAVVVLLIQRTFSLLHWHRQESHLGNWGFTRLLCLAVAAALMAASPVYYFFEHPDAACALRPLLAIHASVLTLLGLLFNRSMRGWSLRDSLRGHHS